MRKAWVTLLMCMVAVIGFSATISQFAHTEWETICVDSLRPRAQFGAQLVGDWEDSLYAVSIEYPELLAIHEKELTRWNLTLQDIPEWPEIETHIGVSRGEASLSAGFMPIIRRDGVCYAILSYKWVVQAMPQSEIVPVSQATSESKFTSQSRVTTPSSSGASQPRYTEQSLLANGKWVKIRVKETGVYKLSFNSLRAMGFKEPSQVRLFGYGGAVLPEVHLHELVDDLPEQPLWRGDSYMLFYAQGPLSWKLSDGIYEHEQNTYSDWGYYFLTDLQDSIRKKFAEFQTDSVIGPIIDTYPDYCVHDPDEFSWYRSGRRFFEEYDYAQVNSRSYSFDIEGIKSDSVIVEVAFSSGSYETTKVTAHVNGQIAGVMYVDGRLGDEVASVTDELFLSRGQFKEKNTIRITHDRPSGISGHLDYIRLNYKRDLALYGSNTLFRVGAAVSDVSFSVAHSNPNVQIWRLSHDGTCGIVPSLYSDGRTVTYASSYSPHDILTAVDVKGSFPEPEVVRAIHNQNLHGLDSVDMVIVVPESGKLLSQAERLAQAHALYDSLRTVVVRADMIYNEFSSGTPDATAIRRFMKMLYDRGGVDSSPRYLLLMGSGAWDNRMHVTEWRGGNPADYLLCYESYNSLSHTQSYVMEDYFGFLDDREGSYLINDKVDIGIGRLPVNSAAQARAKVDQLIEYMSGVNIGEWSNKVIVLGDDGDNNIHMSDADKVATVYETMNPALDIDKIYWDAHKMEVSASYNGYPSVRKKLMESLKSGALIVNYSGHGSTEVLSHELVMSKSDMNELKSKYLPFWITASCDIAPFDTRTESLGMNLMNNADGGAIGMLTTTRTVHALYNAKINRSFSRHLLSQSPDGGVNRVGDALRLAKNELVTAGKGESDDTENKIHFVLLGDPALRLAVPKLTAVVDSFYDVASGQNSVARAGSIISVTGHIECNGKPVTDYNGELWATVYDNERIITCYNNSGSATKPFQFKCRDRVLFAGTDSVRDGEFSFSFPVPMDINYSNESGKIILFAHNGTGNTANGLYEEFTVGGTASEMALDSIGPRIYLYLNTPTFQYGAKVNPTPLLVAELADSSGLNTSGNGLGHDILLVIDNNPAWTWVLNDYFEQTQGDYTSGRVVFPIPELPEGKHEIMLRAWDVMNNSTTVFLGFNVVSDLKPSFAIDVAQTPSHENTAFVITHDRPGQNALIKIEVVDSNGMLQWVTSVRDESDSGAMIVGWNNMSSGGHKLKSGLYIVRATVQDGGSNSSVASCKFVILDY